MLNPRIELAVSVGFIVAILFGLYQTSRIDLAFSSDLETFSGPRAYPGLILSILLVLFVSIAAGQFRRVLSDTGIDSGQVAFLGNRILWSAALMASLCVFVLSFESIGYILTMVPLLTFVGLLCGARSVLRSIVVSVCLAAVCLMIFRYGLATVLPEGILGIDTVF